MRETRNYLNRHIDASSLKTSEEVIQEAGLNYVVKKGNAYVKYIPEDAESLGQKGDCVKNTFFTYRDDTGALLCADGKALTKNYQVIQNKEAFTFFDNLIESGIAEYNKVGTLKEGRLIFIYAKIKEDIELTNDEVIKLYIFMYLAHDGSSSVTVKLTPVRHICTNMISAGGVDTIRIRHSANYKDKLDAAESVLKLVNINRNNIIETFNNYSTINITNADVIDLIQQVYLTKSEILMLNEYGHNVIEHNVDTKLVSARKQNIITDVYNYYFHGIGQNTSSATGTLWGFVNAITGYNQNVKNYKTEEAQESSSLFGGVATINKKAFKVANKFINN